MFKLVNEGGGMWAIKEDGRAIYYGTFVEVSEHLENAGVSRSEIVYARDELESNNHTIADFGINNMFTFTDGNED